jgi:3-methyladenine DNA glycosylase AlkD
LADPQFLTAMARFGIRTDNALGVPVPQLRTIAGRIGRNHSLAGELWASGIHEARLLATMIDDPDLVDEAQMERWVKNFDSWDICDQCCGNLFDKTEFAWQKAMQWTGRSEEFVKRSGFALMAALAVHDKSAKDSRFADFFEPIKREATDERNFVRKAANWALRQIGKRNRSLNKAAVKVAREIRRIDSRAARWIAADALRELTGDKTQTRLRKQEAGGQ